MFVVVSSRAGGAHHVLVNMAAIVAVETFSAKYDTEPFNN